MTRTLVLLHGMAAALALASAIHMYFMLPKRRIPPRGVALGFLLTMVPLYVLGWWTYPEFRTEIRFDLLTSAPWLANIFDVKEFLSWGALMAGLAVGVLSMQRKRLDEVWRRVSVSLMGFIIFVLAFNTVVGILLANHKML